MATYRAYSIATASSRRSRILPSSQLGSGTPEYSILLSILLLFSVPVLQGMGAGVNSTEAALEFSQRTAQVDTRLKYAANLPIQTNLPPPSWQQTSNPGNNPQSLGGGTESNTVGGIEKARTTTPPIKVGGEDPLRQELMW